MSGTKYEWDEELSGLLGKILDEVFESETFPEEVKRSMREALAGNQVAYKVEASFPLEDGGSAAVSFTVGDEEDEYQDEDDLDPEPSAPGVEVTVDVGGDVREWDRIARAWREAVGE